MASCPDNTRLSVVLDRRKALILSTDAACQTDSPYKLPKQEKNATSKVHWSKLRQEPSNQRPVLQNGSSSTNQTRASGKLGGVRSDVRVVLEDVLKTPKGLEFLQQLAESQSGKGQQDHPICQQQTKGVAARRRRDHPQTSPVDPCKLRAGRSPRLRTVDSVEPTASKATQSNSDHSDQTKLVYSPKGKGGLCETSESTEISKSRVWQLFKATTKPTDSRPPPTPEIKDAKPVSSKSSDSTLVTPKCRNSTSVTSKISNSKSVSPKSDDSTPLTPKCRNSTLLSPKINESKSVPPKSSDSTLVTPKCRNSTTLPPKSSDSPPVTPRGSDATQLTLISSDSSPGTPKSTSSSPIGLRRPGGVSPRSPTPRSLSLRESEPHNSSPDPPTSERRAPSSSRSPGAPQALAPQSEPGSDGPSRDKGGGSGDVCGPHASPHTKRRSLLGGAGPVSDPTGSKRVVLEDAESLDQVTHVTTLRATHTSVDSPHRTPHRPDEVVLTTDIEVVQVGQPLIHRKNGAASYADGSLNGALRKPEESRNGVMRREEEECTARKSVLRLTGETRETERTEEPPIKCLRLSQSANEQQANAERQSLIRTTSQGSRFEPIVLSSEDEEEEEEEEPPFPSIACDWTSDGVSLPGPDEEAFYDEVEEDDHGDGHDADSGRGCGCGDDEEEEEEEGREVGLPGPYIKVTIPNHTEIISPLELQEPVFNGGELSHLPTLEFPFSFLLMGGVKALANGKLEITDDSIIFPLLDSTGTDIEIAIATADIQMYSLLDGQEFHCSGLAVGEDHPPSVQLLLWVSKDQARRLHSDLSIIQPKTRPVEGSVCVCVCLHESVLKVDEALLQSVMDIVGLRQHNTHLLSPLPRSHARRLLCTSPADTHLLPYLGLEPIHTHTANDSNTPSDKHTHTLTDEGSHASTTLESTNSHTTDDGLKDGTNTVTVEDTHTLEPPTLKDEDTGAQPSTSAEECEQVYSLLHCHNQGVYSVIVETPGPEWVPYKHTSPAQRLIQFPPPPSKGGITVTTEDLQCLDAGEFLNDVIIDFYLKYLMSEVASMDMVNRSHVFSSFFYKQLTRRDNANEDNATTTAEQRRHQRVKTWTRNVDIFSKDFLFVPVNQESHWYLVVICFPGLEEAQYVAFDGPATVNVAGDEDSGETQAAVRALEESSQASTSSETKDSDDPLPTECTLNTCSRSKVCQRPCILIMDSLKLTIHKRVVKLLQEYLQVEWEVRRGGNRVFGPDVFLGSNCHVPLQNNSSDCGLYLLHYAESFLQDPVVHFDLPLRLELWFPRQQVRRKRDDIRNLILRLCRFQSQSTGGFITPSTC